MTGFTGVFIGRKRDKTKEMAATTARSGIIRLVFPILGPEILARGDANKRTAGKVHLVLMILQKNEGQDKEGKRKYEVEIGKSNKEAIEFVVKLLGHGGDLFNNK